uniref:BicC family RNA binding protein 1 n=1 Tax=Astyanax mexicanus TaxID=7994 RepID=W5KVW5_ASTMX
ERSADSPLPASEDDFSGHVYPPDPAWTEERFRVDRKKLETMLLVMDETNTQITWPSKLKIGAKSKKPHIKVNGKRDDVREAKERILSILDTKSNRVTLKMDVSHTEHSHVIGKGGNNIKRVMEDTGCHIHFPDSNRNNQGEKSNQELLPLALVFECGGLLEQLDCNSPIVQHISQSCNVTIACKPPSHLYGNTGVVRGNQSNATAVKRGTALLLDHLAGSMAGSVLVSTQLDIAPQHHLALLGRNGANLKHITQRTGARIHFPDPSTHSHSHTSTRRSTVYIQGSIDAVCDARQQLMGCLPLVLMFDVKEEVEIETHCINTLMEQLDVFISIKPKPKQPSKSVIVKSVERNAENMYEVRRLLLAVESSCGASPSIPLSLSPPVSSEAPFPPDTSSISVNGHSPASPLLNPVGLDIFASAGLGLSTLLSGSSGISSHNSSCSPNPVLTGNSSALNGPNRTVSTLQDSNQSNNTHSNTHVYTPTLSSIHNPSFWTTTLSTEFSSVLMMQSVSQGSLSGLLLSGVHSFSPSHTHNHTHSATHSQVHTHTPSPPPGLAPIHKPVTPEQLKTHIPGSVYQGISSLSESLLGPSHCDSVQEINGHSQSEALSSKSSSNESDTFVEVGMPRSPSHSANGNDLKQMLASCSVSPGKRPMELLQGKNTHLAYDYEQKKLLATKMLKKPVVTEVRTPTNTWSGLGFSKSMPAESIKQLRRASRTAYKPAVRTMYEIDQYLSSSNYMDCISSMGGSKSCSLSSSLKGTDLPELFSTLGLGKYIDVFQQQEIDLQTFVTLTDPDLKELGITTFGARRKMLLAISLNKSRWKLLEPANIPSSFLDGGASGRLSRQFHADMASISGRW